MWCRVVEIFGKQQPILSHKPLAVDANIMESSYELNAMFIRFNKLFKLRDETLKAILTFTH